MEQRTVERIYVRIAAARRAVDVFQRALETAKCKLENGCVIEWENYPGTTRFDSDDGGGHAYAKERIVTVTAPKTKYLAALQVVLDEFQLLGVREHIEAVEILTTEDEEE